jgi:rusticyanin
MASENFEVAGMVDPTVVVPRGAQVTVQFANADTDMAHGLVVTANTGAASSPMPMMATAPAFSGAAFWFLGDATSAGMHTGTLSFTAATAGTYEYLCPVPGHAEEGMAGSFLVEATS